MAPAGPSPDAPTFDELSIAAQRAIDVIARLDDDTDVTAKALEKLRSLARGGGSRQWREFRDVANLKAGKRSGADKALAAVRELGARVLRSPALHADVRRFSSLLAARVVELGSAYARFKEERGLADYGDLELLLLRLLEDPDDAAHLAADLELVVVDEFQDTSPLQLAIFQRLRALVPESRWVGDAKQAIYGFRGADPALVDGVVESAGAAPETLKCNYRSNAALVGLVGRLFREAFGDEASLEPHRDTAPGAVERWVLEGKNMGLQWAGLADGVARLRAAGRPCREIAVLARKNSDAQGIAAACEARGIPALLELPGILAGREGAVVLAALRVLADPGDSLAAATVLHLLDGDPAGPTPAWLERRLRRLAARSDGGDALETFAAGWQGEEVIERLRAIEVRGLAPSQALTEAVAALDLASRIQGWGEPSRRAANLDTLTSMAGEYEREAAASGSAPTLAGLVTHLDGLDESRKDTIKPPYGIDAITVSTYHRAKGLEWPVVVLTSLDSGRDPDLWQPEVTGGSPGSGDPLEGRRLRFWPWPFGFAGMFGKRAEFPPLDKAADASDEGIAARARDDAEALRLLYVGFTRAKDVLVLAHPEGKDAWLRSLPGVNALLPTTPPEGEAPATADGVVVDLPDLGTTYTLRRLTAGAAAAGELQTTSWLAAPAAAGAAEPVARFHNPSAAKLPGGEPAMRIVTLEPQRPALVKLAKGAERQLGEAVHTYFAALPSLRVANADQRLAVAERCLRAFGVADALQPGVLVEMGVRFEAWVADVFPDAAWLTETPLVGLRTGGGSWRGAVDLLLELPSGAVVVVDHKAGATVAERVPAKAAVYAGQLAAYREALEAQGLEVDSCWLHFPLAGALVGLVSPPFGRRP